MNFTSRFPAHFEDRKQWFLDHLPELRRPRTLVETGMWAFVLGMIAALGVYKILPLIGFDFSGLLSFKKLLALGVLSLGGIAYLAYMRWIVKHPLALTAFSILLWPALEFTNECLLMFVGLNLHMRPLLFMVLAVPSLWIVVRNFKWLWQQWVSFRGYLVFLVWVLGYFIFFQPPLENMSGEANAAIVQLLSYFYCFTSLSVMAVGMAQHPWPERVFDRLNKWFLGVSALLSLVTILGYPLGGLFSVYLDGFLRARGTFNHPNPFSHHMGFTLLYILGLLFYYQSGVYRHRVAAWLLYGSAALNGVAFLLGLSKTAIVGVSVCSTLVLLFLARDLFQDRRNIIRGVQTAVLLTVLVIIGLVIFHMVSDYTLLELLQSRVEKTQSWNWRVEVWDALMGNMSWFSVLFGHGFTASNAWIFQMTFNTTNNTKPLMMVHNGYISLLYDFGLMGYLLFASVMATLVITLQRLKAFWGHFPEKALLASGVAMVLYFMFVSAFDEMVYMFDAAQLFWILSTGILVMVARSRPPRLAASGPEEMP